MTVGDGFERFQFLRPSAAAKTGTGMGMTPLESVSNYLSAHAKTNSQIRRVTIQEAILKISKMTVVVNLRMTVAPLTCFLKMTVGTLCDGSSQNQKKLVSAKFSRCLAFRAS